MEDKYIITLDNDDKYVIVSKIEYNNETYCYLGKLDNDIKYFYGKIINGDLEIITDKELISYLAPLLSENA